MSVLRIDFETRSAIDISDCGAYVYARHPSTDIWCMAWAFDEDEPEIWSPGTDVPVDVAMHVLDGGEIHAWNANFERTIWRTILVPKYGFPVPTLGQYHCSMAQAAAYGLPQSLDHAAEVLGVEEQKDREGKRLMLQMSRPRKTNPDGTHTWWDDDAEKLQRLYEYCKQDVRAERAVVRNLKSLPPDERKIYILDQQINDRGVFLDVPLAEAALKCAGIATEDANAELEQVTDGNVKSVTEVIGITSWIEGQGVECNSISKDSITAMLTRELPPAVRRVLEIRSEAGKSSVAKVQKMLDYAAVDDRMRGMLAYHGAATGRWAGRGPQPQNYPRGTVADVDLLLDLILAVDVKSLSLFAAPLEILSTALRLLMCAPQGRKLVVADFAAIEARVLAWLANQMDLVQQFQEGADTYKTLAAQIYKVAVKEVSKTQRFVGKTARLGLGYSMGPKKFVDACKKMAGVDITEDESADVVNTYRTSNSKIVDLWDNLQDHALAAVKYQAPPPRVRSKWKNSEPKAYDELRVKYSRDADWLYCRLPSGRSLKYAKPKIVPREMSWTDYKGKPVIKDSIQVMGFNGMTRKWERQYLYGGLLAENVVQALARDLMAQAMMRVEEAEYSVILTVHDEVVSEVPEDFGCAEEFERLMCVLPAWAEGCPVAAEGWEGPRYRK